MTFSEKTPFVVGSKIIDWAMRIITKGELTKATMTWKQANFGTVMSRSLQLPTLAQTELGWKSRWFIPLQGLSLWRWRNSAWTMSGVPSTPHWRSLFPIWYSQCAWQYQCQGTLYVGPCASRPNARPPSCLLQWWQLLPMESYIWGPLQCPCVYTTWVLTLLKFLQKWWLARSCLPTKYHWQPFWQWGWRIPSTTSKKGGSWRPGPPRPGGMAQTGARTGQGAAA